MEGKIITNGKRKSAVARAVIENGTGKITVNRLQHTFLELIKRLMIEEPLRIAKEHGELNYDITVRMKGGGQESQIEAARLAIARALVEAFKKDGKNSEELRRAFLNYDRNMLIADVRVREAYKPGDSKARAKRQKSYR